MGRFAVPLAIGGVIAVTLAAVTGLRPGGARRGSRSGFQAVATACPGGGVLHLLAVTQAGGLLAATYQEPGRWSDWQDLRPPTPVRDVAASVPTADQLEVSCADVDGQVWTAVLQLSGAVPRWSRLPGSTRNGRIARLAALSMSPGHGEIFAVDEYGGVVHNWHHRDGIWQAEWTRMRPTSECRDVAASVPTSSLMEIFTVGTGQRILNHWYVAGSGWQEWTEGFEAGLGRACVALDVLNGWDEHQEVFVVRADGGISHRDHWQGQPKPGWRDLDAPAEMRDVACGTTSTGHLEVFGVSRAGELWQKSYPDGADWSGWRPVGIRRAPGELASAE
ncbi:hypothetical protein AB0M43_08690 [Longispora sp. NPDC051575]|uniref:hypothetical protein n=1 Tax=Longispora sp. NPDC051575 TaxID=3154943 RepID=UPI003431B0B3